MPVTLTIKHVPDELAARLRALAARNHRSVQGELMHTLETLLANAGAPTAQAHMPTAGSERAGLASANPGQATANDALLAELDRIVAGSHWGVAPLLNRDQANDRCLTREVDQLLQEPRAPYRR